MRRFLVLGLVGVVIYSVLSLPSFASDASDSADPAETIGLDTLVPLIQNQFGPRLAEIELIESAVPPAIKVDVMDPRPADSQALQTLMATRTGTASLLGASISASQLQALANLASQILLPATTGPISISADNTKGVIDIEAQAIPSAVILALKAAIPAVRLNIKIDSSFNSVMANASRDSYPPYQGGLRMNDIAGALCTSGYGFRNDGTDYASTAGHCGAAEDVWSIGGTILGGFEARSQLL